MAWFPLIVFAFFLAAWPATAQRAPKNTPSIVFQSGGLFNNDFLGDGQDRWRSVSAFHGLDFQRENQRYTSYVRAELIAPNDLTGSSARADRRYAGILEAALTRHWIEPSRSYFLGGGVTITGPMTGIGALQTEFHNLIGSTRPNVLEAQIPNAVFPLIRAGMQQRWGGQNHQSQLNFEAQAGAETFLRAGVDVMFGPGSNTPHLLRDPVTGTPIAVGRIGAAEGFQVLAGADISYVTSSKFLPRGGVDMRHWRNRARLGVAWQGSNYSAFYGLTWLSREFEQQPEGQFLGGIGLSLRF